MIAGLYSYWIVVVLMMAGFYIVIAHTNLIKKLIGLGIFQTSVFILFISMGKVSGGSAPILDSDITIYSNPLPHVLILTAIVVSVATLALGLALVVNIHRQYNSVDEYEIHRLDNDSDKQLNSENQ